MLRWLVKYSKWRPLLALDNRSQKFDSRFAIRLHGLILSCILDSLVFNVAVPFKNLTFFLKDINRFLPFRS